MERDLIVNLRTGETYEVTTTRGRPMTWTPPPRTGTPCRVYWGSHGCRLERGHKGPHLCECADDEGVDPMTREYIEDPGCFNVGAPPYYGPDTRYYGEDAEALGLPLATTSNGT